MVKANKIKKVLAPKEREFEIIPTMESVGTRSKKMKKDNKKPELSSIIDDTPSSDEDAISDLHKNLKNIGDVKTTGSDVSNLDDKCKVCGIDIKKYKCLNVMVSVVDGYILNVQISLKENTKRSAIWAIKYYGYVMMS